MKCFAGLVLVLALSAAPIAGQALYSFDTCPPGPLAAGCPGEPWTTFHTVTVVPSGAIPGPTSGFPTDGSQWCIVHSGAITGAGAFTQGAGGPALLPYAPNTTGMIRIPIPIPTVPAGVTLNIAFDYTYVSPECPNDAFYNDCMSVDFTVAGVSQQNLLYLDTFSAAMTAPAISPTETGAITTGFCATPGTREAGPGGAPKTLSVGIATPLYGQTVDFEVNVADGGDNAFNSWAYIDNIRFVVNCQAPTISISQPGGIGAPVFVDNGCLVTGRSYFNAFSFDLCPGGPGTGPIGGLCFSDINFLIFQLSTPFAPFNFIAGGPSQSHGPFSLPTPFAVDCVSVDITGGVINVIGQVFRGGGN